MYNLSKNIKPSEILLLLAREQDADLQKQLYICLSKERFFPRNWNAFDIALDYYFLTKPENCITSVWYIPRTEDEFNKYKSYKDFKANCCEHRVMNLLLAAAIAQSEGN